MVAGALIGTFSNTRAQLVGSRVVLGIGTIFGSKSGLSLISRFCGSLNIFYKSDLTAASLVPEIAHPRVRHMAGGFLFTTYNVRFKAFSQSTTSALMMKTDWFYSFCVAYVRHGLLAGDIVGVEVNS